MTVLETLLIIVGVPAALYALIMLLVLWPRLTRVRYRTGQEWAFEPVLWVAHPAAINASPPATRIETRSAEVPSGNTEALRTVFGGARGGW